jgi:hypothetical protein
MRGVSPGAGEHQSRIGRKVGIERRCCPIGVPPFEPWFRAGAMRLHVGERDQCRAGDYHDWSALVSLVVCVNTTSSITENVLQIEHPGPSA